MSRKQLKSRLLFYLSSQGISFTNNLSDSYDFAIYWNNNLVSIPDKKILDISKNKKVLNINCTNVTKKKIDEIQEQVFGYKLCVDPFIYRGKGVIRNNKQAQGYRNLIKVVNFPIKVEEQKLDKYDPNYILYQKFIDTYDKNGFRIELRVIICIDKIPLVFYKKFDDKKKPFKHRHSQDLFIPVDPNVVFTDFELNKILEYSKKIGLDFGEIDILKKNDKIYVTDVNNLPGNGSFINSIKKDGESVVKLIGKSLILRI